MSRIKMTPTHCDLRIFRNTNFKKYVREWVGWQNWPCLCEMVGQQMAAYSSRCCANVCTTAISRRLREKQARHCDWCHHPAEN